MPYIRKQDRDRYDPFIDDFPEIITKGDLEYIVTKLMKTYMSTREYRYGTLHEVVYAVAHASDEFRRRHLDKREDEAILENGDI